MVARCFSRKMSKSSEHRLKRCWVLLPGQSPSTYTSLACDFILFPHPLQTLEDFVQHTAPHPQ